MTTVQDPSGEYTDYGAADNNNYNEYGEGFYDSAPEEGNGYEDGKETYTRARRKRLRGK